MQGLRRVTSRGFARLREHGPKLLRLTVFLFVLGVGLALFTTYRARAQLGEIMMGVGADMMRYHDAERQDAPRQLVLNGQPIHFASGTTEHDVTSVLDYYETRCQERDGNLREHVTEMLDGKTATPSPVERETMDAVLRDETDDRGYVACLDMGERGVDVEGLIDRLERFEKSLDLSDVGHMRYVFAEQGGGTTHFVAFWTEGKFPLREMFPREGDAPGRDPDGLPRPPKTRRVLSAYEKGHPQSMTVYARADWGVERFERYYRGAMDEQGWKLLETERQRARDDLPPLLVFEREERMVSVALGTDDADRGVATVLVSR